MKELNFKREFVSRLQDEEMANILGAKDQVSNSAAKRLNDDTTTPTDTSQPEGGISNSCCQKSCK